MIRVIQQDEMKYDDADGDGFGDAFYTLMIGLCLPLTCLL